MADDHQHPEVPASARLREPRRPYEEEARPAARIRLDLIHLSEEDRELLHSRMESC